MVRKATKGTIQLATAVDEVIGEKFRAFCRARGETIRDVVERMMQREMANPAEKQLPPPFPPLTTPKRKK